MSELTIREALLDGDLLGYYDPDLHEIVLDRRLTQAERTATLQHELCHAERGHSGDGPLAAKQERWATVEAARRLMPLDELAEALRWCRDDHDLADYFGVDLATVKIRRKGLSLSDHRVLAEGLDEGWEVA